MRISILGIGAIASVLTINSVMAAKDDKPNPDIAVAAKSYVDARDDLKQDIIPRTGANEGTLGNTVVTYTDREGAIGERGIYDGGATYTNNDADSLVTAEVVHDFAAAVENLSINNQVLTRVDGNGNACSSGDDCNLWLVGDSTQSIAPAGTFAPLTAALKGYGESATSASECASGYLQSGQNKCGCDAGTQCSSFHIGKCSQGTIVGCNANHICSCI
ncbi:MAG: hypothetical protein IJQ90_00980 [Alphaproteobacteria bacterium]|nr:hypothetical protein [Alphaproteobacteria bacterium]